ncbi:glycosyltransferase [Halorubrum sp. ASP1]|uniref:glycosyltransferase family 2 protein n=1 Tax=Halorubrum sp. ASP1 TaxID=2518114 RepID=UPI0010F553F3|nr:glycosyltransferase family 2 protein [Halorubrum sp. ASP1]TKX62981.1 glycosyltransferase [Halorubrum sp. ASP1]
MKISIITPVFNEPRVRHTLESIHSQKDVPELESIVVDGGSTDETTSILDECADQIDTLISEPDDGTYDAMNKGINHATGDIVGILNADDIYNGPNVLRSVLERFNQTDTDLCYGDLVYVDDNDDVVRYWKSGEYTPRRFYFGWMPPHPTVFVRRDVYDTYGTFDLDFPIAADYEFLLRVLLKNEISTAYVDDTLVRMATGGQSNASVRNIITANLEVYRAWQKHDLRGGVHVPVVKPLRKIPQFLHS